MSLNRNVIVHAALEFMNEHGLDKLTTRGLGESLGVEGPALYRHFQSKGELLDHMAAAILLPVMEPPASGQTWDDWLRSIAYRSVAAVTKYRDGAKLLAHTLPIEPLDLLSKPLSLAGFAGHDAVYASKLFTRFMVGWQLMEDRERRRRDRPEQEYDHLKAFDFALESIIDGMRLRLHKPAG